MFSLNPNSVNKEAFGDVLVQLISWFKTDPNHTKLQPGLVGIAFCQNTEYNCEAFLACD